MGGEGWRGYVLSQRKMHLLVLNAEVVNSLFLCWLDERGGGKEVWNL